MELTRCLENFILLFSFQKREHKIFLLYLIHRSDLCGKSTKMTWKSGTYLGIYIFNNHVMKYHVLTSFPTIYWADFEHHKTLSHLKIMDLAYCYLLNKKLSFIYLIITLIELQKVSLLPSCHHYNRSMLTESII